MKNLLLLTTSILLFVMQLESQNLSVNSNHLWKAQEDLPYWQESSARITTDQPVQSLAIFENRCFCTLKGELFELTDERLTKIETAPSGILELKKLNNQLWALTSHGLYFLDTGGWNKQDDRLFVDLCLHQGVLHGATREEVYRLKEGKFVSIQPQGGYYTSDITMLQEDGSQINDTPISLGPITRIQSHGGTLFVLRPGELVLFDGQVVNKDFVDWGRLPSKQTHNLLSLGSKLYVSTEKGLSVLRGASLHTISGKEGLPVEQTSCLTSGGEGDLWIGTSRGAIHMINEKEWQYFGAQIWLPNNHVNAIAVGMHKVFIATDGGIGIINYEPYTLLKKTTFYERHLEEWGHKRMGFIHGLYRKNGEWVREVSDNDGGHTAPYLAAMCYKYACTGDLSARNEAVKSAMAMI